MTGRRDSSTLGRSAINSMRSQCAVRPSLAPVLTRPEAAKRRVRTAFHAFHKNRREVGDMVTPKAPFSLNLL